MNHDQRQSVVLGGPDKIDTMRIKVLLLSTLAEISYGGSRNDHEEQIEDHSIKFNLHNVLFRGTCTLGQLVTVIHSNHNKYKRLHANPHPTTACPDIRS